MTSIGVNEAMGGTNMADNTTINGLGSFQYTTSEDRPIFYGEMEVIHDECPFLSIADNLHERLNMQILSRQQDKTHQTVRFHVNQEMGKISIQSVLSDSMGMNRITNARVFVNGGTTFELTCNDDALNIISEITELPFGQIAQYRASKEKETFTIYSPTLEDMTGKERLLALEEQLGQYGNVDLLQFRKITRNDLAITNFIDQHGDFPEIWLNQDELQILTTSMDYGYFDSPKRIGLDELANKFDMSKALLSDRLRQVNRHVLDRFVKQMNQPFLP